MSEVRMSIRLRYWHFKQVLILILIILLLAFLSKKNGAKNTDFTDERKEVNNFYQIDSSYVVINIGTNSKAVTVIRNLKI